jgi:hypothetical protein
MRAQQRLDQARRDVTEVAERFSTAAEEIVAAALERGFAALLRRQQAWGEALREDESEALRRAVADEVLRSAARVAVALRDPDLWLAPSVRVDEGPGEDLDAGLNRVWITLLTSARGFDHLLGEFGLPRSDLPEAGGGHYGLQPQSLEDLDPNGRLAKLWQRYLKRYRSYASAARNADGEVESR